MQLSEDRIVALRTRIASDYATLDARDPDYSFSREEYADRLARLCAEAAQRGIDTLVLSAPDSICWLHGYESRWFKAQSSSKWLPLMMTVVRVSTREMVHYDDHHHRYLLQSKSVATELHLGDADGKVRLDEIVRDLDARGWLRGVVGFEFGSHVPNRATSDLIVSACVLRGAEPVDATLVSRVTRRVKSPAELAAIERAAEICDAGIEAMLSEVRPGITERHAWGALMRGMAEAGGGPAALHESVVVGPIELGHAYSSDRVLQRGDVLCADPSGSFKQYHANIERWYVVGEEPADELRELAAVEAKAFEILCEGAVDGAPVQAVTDRIREHLERNGMWGLEDWNGGYELGLSFAPDWVGEWTFTVGERTSDRFVAGTVTNYESIVMYPMTDTVIFEADGARRLSRLPLDVLRAG